MSSFCKILTLIKSNALMWYLNFWNQICSERFSLNNEKKQRNKNELTNNILTVSSFQNIWILYICFDFYDLYVFTKLSQIWFIILYGRLSGLESQHSNSWFIEHWPLELVSKIKLPHSQDQSFSWVLQINSISLKFLIY